MSSNEDKNVIKFPGSAGLNQHLQENQVLDKQDEYSDNVIYFPSVNQTHLLSSDKKQSRDKGVRTTGETDLNVINKTDREFWNSRSLKKGDSSPPESPIENEKTSSALAEQNGGNGKGRKPSRYTISSVACALCLMLVGVPVYNTYKKPSKERFLATPDGMLIMPIRILKGNGEGYKAHVYEDRNGNLDVNLVSDRGLASVIEDEEENKKNRETLKSRLDRQEKKILHLIKTGRRKIASIGHKPATKDRFLMEVLQSRYDVQWNRGKLSYAVLLEGRKPVEFPPMDKIVKEYKSLFPRYATMRRQAGSSESLEVYELRNTKDITVERLQTSRDEQGRLLSIHVVSD